MRRGILVMVVMVVMTGCGGTNVPTPSSISLIVGSGGPSEAATPSADATDTPSPKPTAKATPKPSPKPTPKPTPVCLASMLAAEVTGWNGAAGSQIAAVTLTNTSAKTCTVQGTPEVELVDKHGAILIDSQTGGPNGLPHIAAGAKAFRLAPKGHIKTEVAASNYCGAGAATPTTVAFVLPSGAGRLVAAPGPGGSTPPCNGAKGSLGRIGMNGWKK